MGYIFEAEIESIIHAARVKTIGEEDDVVLKKILTAPIHPAIKAYFRAEVEKTLAQERALEYRSKKFPYSLAQVRSLEEQIDLLLVQNYRFGLQEFESLLDESVHFQFNYLCRPQWTLLNFIIGDQRRVAASTIEKRLRYCIDYSYFPELIRRYIVDHGLAEVTYEELKSLIEKIDSEVVVQHSSNELAHMTRALFDFVESGKMIPKEEFEQQTLPINAAIVFFDDKHLTDVRIRLEFERDHNRVLQITVERLADIIEIVRTGNEESTAPPLEVKSEEAEHIGLERGLVPGEESGLTLENIPPENLQESQNVLEPEESGAGRLPPGIYQQRILELLSEKEHRRIVKKLFSNDETAFLGAITEISSLAAWEHAAQYLDTLFRANDVDPFGKDAVLLTDKLFTYFHSFPAGE